MLNTAKLGSLVSSAFIFMVSFPTSSLPASIGDLLKCLVLLDSQLIFETETLKALRPGMQLSAAAPA
jgi:hypothetical protein